MQLINDKKLFDLTTHQSKVFNCPARFRALVAGRRFGKTHLALIEMFAAALEPNRAIWYVAPNNRQSKQIAWARLKTLTRPYWAKNPSESELRIDLVSGSTITVRGALHPDSLRGSGLDLIVLDECAFMKPEAWLEVLRPALADRKGRALFIGTPNGRNHLYDRFQYLINDPAGAAFQFTTEQGGLIDADELQSLARELDSEVYRQEICGEFIVAGTKRVYYAFDPANNVRPSTFEPQLPLIWAIDFNVNPMSMLLIQRVEDVVQIFDEIILPNANTETACRAFLNRIEPLSGLVPHFKQPMQIHVYADSSGNQHRTSATSTDWDIIRDVMSNWKGRYQAHLHKTPANPLVRDRVNLVNRRLCTKSDDSYLFVDARCHELLKDLEQVVWATDPNGQTSAEIDKSDRRRTHTSDALGYYIAQAFPVTLRPIGPQSSGRLI